MSSGNSQKRQAEREANRKARLEAQEKFRRERQLRILKNQRKGPDAVQ